MLKPIMILRLVKKNSQSCNAIYNTLIIIHFYWRLQKDGTLSKGNAMMGYDLYAVHDFDIDINLELLI